MEMQHAQAGSQFHPPYFAVDETDPGIALGSTLARGYWKTQKDVGDSHESYWMGQKKKKSLIMRNLEINLFSLSKED